MGLMADLEVFRKFAPTGIQFPYRPDRSESLYRLRYPGPPILHLIEWSGIVSDGSVVLKCTNAHLHRNPGKEQNTDLSPIRLTRRRYIVVRIGRSYGLDDSGIESWQGQNIFLLPSMSWYCEAHPACHWVVPEFCIGVKRPGREVSHSSTSNADVKN